MLNHLSVLFPLLHNFARGGGGGSGGGGSGGSGGGGGVGGFLFIVGYYLVAGPLGILRKILPRWVTIAVGIPMALIISVAAIWVLKGYGVITAVGAFVGVPGGINNWTNRIAGKIMRAKKQQHDAALKDGAWEQTKVTTRVHEVFNKFQQDWSSFNLKRMQTYLTPRYFTHIRLMLLALQQMGRRNDVLEPRLLSQSTSGVLDAEDNSQDRIAVAIQADADDQLIEVASGETLSRDTSRFREEWKFARDGDEWKLDGIDQATANAGQAVASLQEFADNNGMFYSLDMGWLLLPQRGQLFDKARFKTSDINNHVIGEWNGHIVQLYTYIPARANQQADNYLIGQIGLPKSYGGIIIKRKPKFSLFAHAPRGYQQVSLEWPDFNNRYTVYATDMDKVTSFELLNPAYMANLYDKNLPINIEVVDNVVYLYAKVLRVNNRYGEMLDVLQGAFKELRM